MAAPSRFLSTALGSTRCWWAQIVLAHQSQTITLAKNIPLDFEGSCRRPLPNEVDSIQYRQRVAVSVLLGCDIMCCSTALGFAYQVRKLYLFAGLDGKAELIDKH